jgi:hypothetical protein
VNSLEAAAAAGLPTPVERTAGGFDDLQCTGDPGAVARLQPFGGDGVAPRQFNMQRLDAIAFQPPANRVADL